MSIAMSIAMNNSLCNSIVRNMVKNASISRTLIAMLTVSVTAFLLQSCAISHAVGSITSSKKTVFTNKVIYRTPTTQQVVVRVEQFVDERPALEMVRSERAKTDIGAKQLDRFTYGEFHQNFADNVRKLFYDDLRTSMAFSGMTDGSFEIIPAQVLIRGRIKSYYGYLEALDAGAAGLLGEMGTVAMAAVKPVQSGGNVEIELQFIDRKTNAVLYATSIRGTAPNEDRFIPRGDNADYFAYEYVDNSIFVDAFNEFTKQLSTVDLASKVSK
jgi:hypothetical protein